MIEPKFKEFIKDINNNISKPIVLKESKIPKFLGVTGITLGKTIHVNPDRFLSFMSLLHETTHILEQGKMNKTNSYVHFKWYKTLAWYIKYSFPQNLFLLSFLTFYKWFFIFFLLSLLPLPFLQKFRFNQEVKGYYWNYYHVNYIVESKLNLQFTKYYPYFKLLNKPKTKKYYNLLFSNYSNNPTHLFIKKFIKRY